MSTDASNMILGYAERARRQAEEHERRMATDPEYRREQERITLERRQAEEADRAEGERQRLAAITKRREEKAVPAAAWPYLDVWRAGGGSDLPSSVVKAHAWVQRFLAGAPRWSFLFLIGPVGVGKTVAACWFLDAPRTTSEPGTLFGGAPRQVTRETSGKFVSGEELAKASSYSAEFWDGLRDAPRLVIDDLGAEELDAKGHALGNIVALLYSRHANGRPTVITGNVTQQAFLARYAAHDGGRLRDRLAESAWFVPLAGPSLRRRLVLEEDAA